LEIKDKITLITGGAKGLGLAIASHLAALGSKIIIVDLDTNALASLPNSMEGYTLDVTCPTDVKMTINKIMSQHKQIDILINNAGVIYNEPMVNLFNAPQMMHNYENFRKALSVNLDSVFIMTSAVAEQMVLNRTQGAIINISSISANGNEGQTAYSAAKAGVNAMTVTWSKELGKLGIRCNAVAPGFIETESTHHALNESIIKHIVSNTPLRRLGHAHNVAEAVASIIKNDFMNGIVLPVHGGLTI